MGKPKLVGVGSSIKALLKGPRTMTLVCVQQAKTDSFREVYKSFNSMYYTASSSSAATTNVSSSVNEEESTDSPLQRPLAIFLGDESFSASCSSSRSVAESSESDPSAESLPKEAISARRFFFSPCTTKSIMEVEEHSQKEEQEEEGFLKDLFFERAKEKAAGEAGFCKESVTLAMSSENPYMDFRSSMEEMVVAHGLRDWSCLQELLQCYLRLNEKETHKTIVLAFVDLLMNMVPEEPNKEESKEHMESHCPPCICLDEIMKDGKEIEQEGKEGR